MSENKHTHFIVPTKTYVTVFLALLILTFITVFVAQFDFGSFNLAIAMFVAIIKASLVASIFMGLRYDSGFSTVCFIGSLVFLMIFIALTFTDITTRSDMDPVEGERLKINSPVKPISHDNAHNVSTDHH